MIDILLALFLYFLGGSWDFLSVENCFQVWKIALKEEFNITHLSNISSDAYYEIWHSKYSEPGQLISKNHRDKQRDK